MTKDYFDPSFLPTDIADKENDGFKNWHPMLGIIQQHEDDDNIKNENDTYK